MKKKQKVGTTGKITCFVSQMMTRVHHSLEATSLHLYEGISKHTCPAALHCQHKGKQIAGAIKVMNKGKLGCRPLICTHTRKLQMGVWLFDAKVTSTEEVSFN